MVNTRPARASRVQRVGSVRMSALTSSTLPVVCMHDVVRLTSVLPFRELESCVREQPESLVVVRVVGAVLAVHAGPIEMSRRLDEHDPSPRTDTGDVKRDLGSRRTHADRLDEARRWRKRDVAIEGDHRCHPVSEPVEGVRKARDDVPEAASLGPGRDFRRDHQEIQLRRAADGRRSRSLSRRPTGIHDRSV